MSRRPRVIVIGGGFAGLWAVRALEKAPVEVLLLDRNNHHTFQPLLYQVATAGLAAPSIAAPLRHILRNQRNVTVLQVEVDGIDTAAREVHAAGQRHPYDYLLVASGVSHAYFGHDDWQQWAPGLKTLDDAMNMRARILSAFEIAEGCADPAQVQAQLTFVVVGAGPTGVELAGTLAEVARHTLRREFRRIDPTIARVVLVEAGPRVLPAFPEELSASAERQLQKLGVQVLKGRAITQVDAQGVRIGDERLPAQTVLWAAGVTASPLGRLLGVPLDRNGRVQVAPDLSIPGHPEVFVAGDLASLVLPAGPVPGIAPAAKQMGTYAAGVIAARAAGRAPPPPFHYRHAGLLATIGRMAAVADMGRLRLSGLLAWWLWLLAHAYFLIGFRNRLVVLIDWAGAYWTYNRGARIIVRDR
ncbi:MAG: NAD(P)/FAD-dependent oxidoreductase [Steroidobacteraceae bacterium]